MKIVVIEPLGVNKEEIVKNINAYSLQEHEVVIYEDRSEDLDELIKRASDADVVILANLPFGKSVIDACKNLKMISVAFTGVDHIDMVTCRERGIVVSNAAGYSTEAVSELTIGLILSVYRKIAEGDKETRNLRGRNGFVGLELKGKTVGIIGTGAIGLRVAEFLSVFGCKVLGYSRSEKEEAAILGVKYVSLEELLAKSDIVSLHVPLTEETSNLLNEEKISLMKENSVLINTSRGAVVDNSYLAKALLQKKIAGVGIDVYENEPPLKKDHPLLSAPNTVLLPHVGFATVEAIAVRADMVFENISCWINGEARNVM